MTYHLVHADDATLLASDRAVIKRSERATFTDAVSLLREAGVIRMRTQADADAARDAARAEGLEEARAEVQALIAEQVAAFAEALERHEQSRRAEIAEAAFAAVRAIIGSFDNEIVAAGLVERTLAKLPASGPMTVFVAPPVATAVQDRVGDLSHVTLKADPDLGSHDCLVRTSTGQVIASLSIQLGSLAKRWGVAT
ncbi:FliH/SctL family protein [Sphingomonas xinjiangensis]|uniref:Flagellar assembly protein FliH n=1 Tax=Sphingomonas xinjiangensis TaxID=643568 RepID=A0A840YML9_9SPHN|nr:FliH/SctL family protein [Sphingomonas xinjiangensis]MBB5710900.1 flagellar biosynthesis/type III secretory pathway protein FliH [Sphingomonas xinjiangensis]